ncbi:MAG: MFS transporter [Chloroflexi bacterium]|nr:MFS transporter [Chloroflexota bacterium]
MLWFGTLLGMGAIQMQMISRTILVDDLTGKASLTGIVGLGFAPSMLILSMFGGVAGDRMEKRTLIQITQLASAIMALVVAVLIFTDVIIWQYLLVASVLQGATFAFQMPARQAIIPRLVGKDRLTNAMALSAGGMSMMAIAAPAFAGYVYGSFGPEYVYFTIAAMYLIAVLMTGRIQKVPPEVTAKGRNVLHDVWAGFSYARNNRVVLLLLTSGLVVAILAMPFRLQFPVFARRLYGEIDPGTGLYEFDPNMIGLLLTFAGIGGLLGTIGIANLKEGSRRGLIILIGSVMTGVAILLLASFEAVYVGLFVMLLVGVAESARMTLGQSLSLELTEPAFRARVSSIYMMTFGLMPLGALPLGFAVDAFGARASLLVVSILVIAAGLAFLIGAKSLRRLT